MQTIMCVSKEIILRFPAFLLCLSIAAVSASAATITCLTSNTTQCSTVAANIDISAQGSALTISNNNSLASAIDIIYFDATPNNLISGIVIGAHTGTVSFQQGGAPPDLPLGNLAVPVFNSDFRISSTSNANRIDGGESLT